MFTVDLSEAWSLLPLLILAFTIVGALLLAAFFRNRRVSLAVTATGLLATFASLFFPRAPASGPSLIRIDRFAAYYLGLISLSALAIAVLSNDYARLREKTLFKEGVPEYFIALLLATLGSCVLVTCTHFASFFVGLEVLSVSLYVLIAYGRDESPCIEAGLKYLVLAGCSSAFLLFGMALVYFSLGTMNFSQIGAALALRSAPWPLPILVGGALMLVGVGFKLGLAPFHMWSPDIYEGAPAPATAFVATISKGAMLALTFRLFFVGAFAKAVPLSTAVAIMAIASMFLGNLTALRQNNVKRILAYSSIAHLGYLAIALLAGPAFGLDASAFYLFAYFLTTIAAFGVVSVLSLPDRDADRIEDYSGLFWKRPFLAVVLLLSILSLAGIPLTAGFVGKFVLVASGVRATLWIPVLVLIFNSALALYYYLRLILALFETSALPAGPPKNLRPNPKLIPSLATLALLSIFMVGLGVYPSPLLSVIRTSMQSLELPR